MFSQVEIQVLFEKTLLFFLDVSIEGIAFRFPIMKHMIPKHLTSNRVVFVSDDLQALVVLMTSFNPPFLRGCWLFES
jgi:hypothetical protein